MPTYDWTELFPAHQPPARDGFGLAYDEARSELVLFGGLIDPIPSFSDDTWVWDGTDWTLKSPAASPPARDGATMSYDQARGEIVMFGGAIPGFPLNTWFDDTWTWDGTDWTLKSPATSPPGRNSHALSYDGARANVVMFGGSNGPSDADLFDDTWTWDGTDWTQESPATSPSARGSHEMTYDPVAGKVVLFSGGTDAGGPIDETWTWDGSDWTLESPATSPGGRYNFGFDFDVELGKVLAFGGFSSPTYDDDTWSWDGTDWAQELPANSPSPRTGLSMAYDVARGQLVLFGGYHGLLVSDTWVYDAAARVGVHLAPINIPLGNVPVDRLR